MNAKELDQAIQGRLREVKKRRIWQKLLRIVTTLGKQEASEGSFHTTATYRLMVTVDGIRLSFYKSSYVMCGDYGSIMVDGVEVFNAAEVIAEKLLGLADKTRVVALSSKGRTTKLRIDGYQPGPWQELLNFEKVKKAVMHERASAAKLEKLNREAREQAVPLTGDERKTAARFMIKV